MKHLIVLCLLFASNSYAQDVVIQQPDLYIENQQANKKILTQEAEDAINFLQDYTTSEEYEHIRFFSTYAIPEDKRNDAILTLSFVCHSLTGLGPTLGGYYPLAIQQDGKFVALQQVDGSDTLWWIDLRNYNWSQQSWENVAKQDGYFVEPAVDHKVMGALRLMAGNAILRADWFITNSTDIMRQDDIGQKNNIYRELLYSKVEQPKTVDEFRKIWGLDLAKAVELGNQYGSLVLTSNKVALDNRLLFGYRTELGWLYETYDVKDDTGDRDYLESFPKLGGRPPKTSDAGEIFASNHLHMQVYDLRDGAGNLVDFADPGVARHLTDVLGDARVKVAHSCMDCHAVGPLPAENIIKEYGDFLSLKVPTKEEQLNIDRAFLSDRFEDSVVNNQTAFAIAMMKVNGLSPQENMQKYLELVRWYNQPLTIEQAAVECGMSPEDYVEKFNFTEEVNLVKRIPGRIKLMIHANNSIPIPRNIWESPGRDGVPGMFQQSMIYLYGLTTIRNESTLIEDVDKVEIIEEELILDTDYEYVTTHNDVGVYTGNKLVTKIPNAGTEVTLKIERLVRNAANDEYVFIKYGEYEGLIRKEYIKVK